MPALEIARIAGPLAVGLAGLALVACGETPQAVEKHPLQAALAAGEAILLAPGTALSTPAGERLEAEVRRLDASLDAAQPSPVTVDYPLDGSVFPPGFVSPTFLWHDDDGQADAWLVHVQLDEGADLFEFTDGAPPQPGWIDRRAIAETNEIYQPTEYQASAHSWTPAPAVWAEIQRRSVTGPATVSFCGLERGSAERLLSRGDVRITTSRDEVGAPIFYRDVPLMPSVKNIGGQVKISPLAEPAFPRLEWRLRDVTKPTSKLVMTGIHKCANCHSFSLDGKTMGIDVDGPTGDKGAYAITPLSPQTVIDEDRVITWNSFEGRGDNPKTIGFLSRVSPDGRHTVSTVNEALYVANFANYAYLQVFFPTRGILAWVDAEEGVVRALPGADDPDFVHCNPVWTPDGKSLVFCRALAFDPPKLRTMMARYPNDEREPKIRYDLYRMPFDGGRGGTPEPIVGASANGMSNTFPKVSPDGKWIVFTQCRNGLLMRPDGRLWILPAAGGEAREMRCNTPNMNSWHSFSPNGRWMVFSSKWNRPYTQMFLTHLDEEGNDTPPILIPHATADNRAVNLPEFLNAPLDALDDISLRSIGHEAFTAYFDQGVELMNQGHFDHAVELLEKAVGLRPEDVRARTNLAICLERSGALDDAIAGYRHALAIDPTELRASGALAVLLAPPIEGTGTIDTLRAAAAADPRSLPAHRALGLALARAEISDEAIALLDSIVQAAPDDVVVRRELALIHLRRGDEWSAVPHLEFVAASARDDTRAHLVLAWIQATTKDVTIRDPRRAVAHAETACKLTDSADPRALDALAAAFASGGRMQDAVKHATRALELAKQSDPILAPHVERRLALYSAGKPFGD